MAHSNRLPLFYSKSTSHCTKRRGFFWRYKGPWHCTYAKTSDSASLYRASWFASGGSWLPNAWSPEACLIGRRCCATSCLRFLPAGVSQGLDRNVEARPLYSWNKQRDQLLLVRHTHALSPSHLFTSNCDRDTRHFCRYSTARLGCHRWCADVADQTPARKPFPTAGPAPTSQKVDILAKAQPSVHAERKNTCACSAHVRGETMHRASVVAPQSGRSPYESK